MKKKKESFVVYEDWMRYSKCLTDGEFRQFITAILKFHKGELPEFTGDLEEVWSYIIDDLEHNVQKKQNRRNAIAKNRQSNPKCNTQVDLPVGPTSRPTSTPTSKGMVDGRWEMGDGNMEDEVLDKGDSEMGDKVIEMDNWKREGCNSEDEYNNRIKEYFG